MMPGEPTARRHPILSKTRLPSGRDVPNRLVKAALYEHASDLFGGAPNEAHFAMYRRWARENWGMVITGNVQVSRTHIGLGRDVIIPEVFSDEALQPYRHWAAIIHGDTGDSAIDKERKQRPLAIMQLSHSGRQSPNVIGGRPPFAPALAPSAISVNLNQKQTSLVSSFLGYLMFPTPLEMSLKDIDEAVNAFVKGAQLAAESGFDGIELHGGHGYLIAQFLSPKSNIRTDEYSADTLLFLRRILTSVRAPGVLPDDFVLGIKLNAADYVEGSTSSTPEGNRVVQHFREMVSWGLLDFIEISGGDYEDPDFMMNPTKSLRQALFADFSRRAMKELDQIFSPDSSSPPSRRPLIVLTGGLRTPELLLSAFSQKHADLLGLGRLSVVCPELPRILSTYLILDNTNIPEGLIPSLDDMHKHMSVLAKGERRFTRLLESLMESLPSVLKPEFPKLIGAGMNLARFTVLLRSIGSREEKVFYPGEGLGAMFRMWLWVAPGKSSSSGRWWAAVVVILIMISLWGMLS